MKQIYIVHWIVDRTSGAEGWPHARPFSGRSWGSMVCHSRRLGRKISGHPFRMFWFLALFQRSYTIYIETIYIDSIYISYPFFQAPRHTLPYLCSKIHSYCDSDDGQNNQWENCLCLWRYFQIVRTFLKDVFLLHDFTSWLLCVSLDIFGTTGIKALEPGSTRSISATPQCSSCWTCPTCASVCGSCQARCWIWWPWFNGPKIHWTHTPGWHWLATMWRSWKAWLKVRISNLRTNAQGARAYWS